MSPARAIAHMRPIAAGVGLGLAALLAWALAATPALAGSQFGISASSFTTDTSTSQAGAHADLTTSFALNTEGLGNPVGQLEAVKVELPPGVIGDPQATAKCSDQGFQDFACPTAAQVGTLSLTLAACRGVASHLLAVATEEGKSVLTVASTAGFCASEPGNTITIGTGPSEETAHIEDVASATELVLTGELTKSHESGEEEVTHVAEPATVTVPLFNLQPSPGHVATLAASLLPATILMQVDVREDGSYGLTATISGISTLLSVQAASLTLWGTPADSSHDPMRCNQLGFECGASGGAPAPFMTNPTDCAGSLRSTLTVDSWQGRSATAEAGLAAFTGCEALTMSPALTVTPDTTRLDTPAGYEVDLRVPPDPYGLATPDLRTVSVTLPPGTSLSPAGAGALQGCTDAQFAAGGCPGASKVGTAEVTSPLLADHLRGPVYLRAPTSSETSQMYQLFVIVSADNVVVRLLGHVKPDLRTGQVTTVFENDPQLPFSDFKLKLLGGPGAVLANPATCGPATSSSLIASYAGQTASPSSTFVVDADGQGGACPPSAPFGPSFSAGTTSPLAGGFSPFTLTVSRADGQQYLSTIGAQLPPGLSDVLKSVPLCPEPQASSGGCPQASEIGTATVAAGAGALPLHLSGPVYLTGPYGGAPFGLAIVVHAIAGPFDLGTEVVRTSIAVDPTDAHLTILSSRLPTILAGVPLRLRTVNVTITRQDFMLNPTDCDPLALKGAISSTDGSVESVSYPFQVGGCAGLPFAPKISVLTRGRTSRANGAYLHLKITSGPGQTNIGKVKVRLPKQLPSRLTTLQKACPAGVFEANPASCPAGALVGTGTAATPLLKNPLAGPAYLVSHGGAAFPDLVIVLQGEGITLDLDGKTNISEGVTSSTFASLPDTPISTFDLVLSAGPHSLLAANTNLCKARLAMPAALVGQDGAVVRRTAKVAVTGCAKAKKKA